MARDSAKVPVPSGKIRTLLAALLLRPNQTVSLDQLAERLWGQDPPRNPRRVLQTNVVRLRQSLDLGGLILTQPGGYAACLEPAQLDLLEFQHLIQTAAGAATPVLEGRLLREALALWCGPVCADVESDALHQIDVPPLTEQRLHAVERRMDIDLHLGEHAALVAELRALTIEHPLRERFWAQLMTALYRTGRQADALDAYRTVSHRLKEELGIDPNAELLRLHQDILTQQYQPQEHPRPPLQADGGAPTRQVAAPGAGDDSPVVPPKEEPALGVLLRTWRERALLTQEQVAARAGLNVRTVRRLEAGELRRPRIRSVQLLAEALRLDAEEVSILTQASIGSPGGPSPIRTMLRQLPADVGAFVGREQELAVLDRVGDTATVVITAIDGMAGVGKTALAIHAGHQLSPRFPDGDLFVDLHGYTHGMTAADPADTLARVLGVLGVPGESIPQHIDDRAALYRSVLAGRKMLIVLDNAADEAQVRPLLPGAGGCLVLITSRRRLVGLDGADTVSVDVLPPADAIALFTGTAGQERVAGVPHDLLAEVVRRCGLLPLAIRLAAARLKTHPAWSVSHLLQRLEEHERRPEELQAGQRSVTAALDLSYRELTPAEQHTYRLLGLHAGIDIAPDAAAALLDTTITRALTLLDRLLEVHLLQEPVPGRYRFHDLIRAHAAEKAAEEEPESDRRTALTRLLDHYSQAASAAMDRLYPYEADARPRPPTGTTSMPDPATATTWLDAELANLLALAQYAAEHGFPEHIQHLSVTLHRCLRTRGRYAEAETLHARALTAARAAEDRTSEMEALLGLGEIRYRQNQYNMTLEDTSRALDLARDIGNRSGELRALNTLGLLRAVHGQYAQSIEDFTQALDLAQAIGQRTGELDALIGSGHIHRMMGRHEPAVENLERAFDIARTIGHRTGELRALLGLGHIHLGQGEYGPATDCFTRALDLARGAEHRLGELDSLTALGDLNRLQGRYEHARDCYQQAVDLAREIGNRNWQFEAIHSIGRLQHDCGRPDEALDSHGQALRLATDLDQPGDQARAHDGLAHAHAALGHHDQARHHWCQALAILSALGTGHSDERGVDVESIRAHLARHGDDR
ncbi:BTAD domain-containing putative transcriptional regulator [Streptosporangium soli]|nr:tetratricopeptide repeat protein [Streptosporangium sp. KLBMP 9127]